MNSNKRRKRQEENHDNKNNSSLKGQDENLDERDFNCNTDTYLVRHPVTMNMNSRPKKKSRQDIYPSLDHSTNPERIGDREEDSSKNRSGVRNFPPEMDQDNIGYRCELQEDEFTVFSTHMHSLLDMCLRRVATYRTKEGFWRKPPTQELSEKLSLDSFYTTWKLSREHHETSTSAYSSKSNTTLHDLNTTSTSN